ncbi:MAG TPA: hypothetical protein VES20_00425 [Bryobacteraceae bacterium]|nr:hypothetical protein [Bryobacteraceae bacterium]
MLVLLGSQAGAGVKNLDSHAVLEATHGYRDTAARARSVDRVQQQIHDGLLQ